MYNNNYNNNYSQTPYNGNYYLNNNNGNYVYNKNIQIVRVNGQEGADAYRLPPNSSILLLDQTAPIVWLKMTDGAGYPTLTPYDITPHRLQEQVNQSSHTQELENRINKLEVLVDELFKSNVEPVEQSSKRVIIKQPVESN